MQKGVIIAIVVVLVLLIGFAIWRWTRPAAPCVIDGQCPSGQSCQNGKCAKCSGTCTPSEVFNISTNAGGYNTTISQVPSVAALVSGAQVATPAQAAAALAKGAQWCSGGWTYDPVAKTWQSSYPMQIPNIPGCTGATAPVLGVWPTGSDPATQSNVTLYGVKPASSVIPSCATSGVKGNCLQGWYVSAGASDPNAAKWSEFS